MDFKDVIEGMRKELVRHEIALVEFVDPLSRALQEGNPEKVLEQFGSVYNKALDAAYTNKEGVNQRALTQTLAGGPFEYIPWAMYNALGAVYPYLNREQKDIALRQILNILDRRNFAEVNGERGAGHTTGIREPLLLADITVCRGRFYWPGLGEGEYLIKQYDNFFDFQNDLMDEQGNFVHLPVARDMGNEGVNSDFIVGNTLLVPESSSWGEEYMKRANPQFLERLVRGITWIYGARNKTALKDMKEDYHPGIHHMFEPMLEQGGWADKTQFRP